LRSAALHRVRRGRPPPRGADGGRPHLPADQRSWARIRRLPAALRPRPGAAPVRGRVPTHVAAFCAGLRAHPSVAEIPWLTVAQSVDALGLGKFPPEELRDAANDWCAKTCKKELD